MSKLWPTIENNLLYNFSLQNFIIWISILFCFGLIGVVLNAGNFIVTMLCIELLYVSIMVSFILQSLLMFNSIEGWIISFFLIVLAACESAIGLGLLIAISKYEETLNFFEFNWLRG